MQASTVSAVAAGGSAVFAAASSWNSRKAARASEQAVRDASRQRELDTMRTDLLSLATLYDHSMKLVDALVLDLTRDPRSVEQHRQALRRATMTTGIAPESVQRLLVSAGPLTTDEVSDLQDELQRTAASMRARVLGARAAVNESGASSP